MLLLLPMWVGLPIFIYLRCFNSLTVECYSGKGNMYGIHGVDSSEWDTTLLSAVDTVNYAVCSAFVTIHFYDGLSG